jgi:hypothetical protein
MMERRTFLGILGLSVLAAEAQQARKVWTVELFSAVTSTSAPPDMMATPTAARPRERWLSPFK